MITAYAVVGTATVATELSGDFSIPENTRWVDLLAASAEDIERLERLLGVAAPTEDEMRDIEVSSRLYHEDGQVYMIANAISKASSDKPKTVGVTYIITPRCLITIRSTALHSFDAFAKKSQHQPALLANPDVIFVSLVESTIDRLGDLLKQENENIQELGLLVFSDKKNRDLGSEMRKIGTAGNLASQVHDSLTSFNRLLVFYRDTVQTPTSNALNPRVDVLLRDINSLNEHTAFLSHKVNFYLDAALGAVSAEQNQIIKIFSVAAVIFLPPTLIASVYGMNFDFMPELAWPHGYLFALGLMIISAIVPYAFFKYKGWI